MKQKSFNGDYADKLKETIDIVSRKSKETVSDIIDSSSKQFESALDANRKFMESFEKQIFNKDFIETSIMSEIKKTFSNSVELSEEAIDTIIDIQTDQLHSTIDFNKKLAEIIKNRNFSNVEDREELLGTIEKKLGEASAQLIENTKKITEIYNKHINLVVNFNERFSKNISSQMQILNKFQNKNMDMFNEWAPHWWKSTSKEEATV